MKNDLEILDARLHNIENLLLELKHRETEIEPSLNDLEKFLTVDEAASFLTLSKPTIYRLVKAKRLPAMRQTKRLYFDRKELKHYLEAGRIKLMPDHQKIAIRIGRKGGEI